MQSLSKCDKGNKYLLCVTDLFSKYVWAIPIKDEKGVSIVNAFEKIISKGRKRNKIWKYIQDTMKENLLLLRDLLEP